MIRKKRQALIDGAAFQSRHEPDCEGDGSRGRGARTTAGTATAEPPHLTVPHVARAPQLDDFTAMDVDDTPNGMAKVQRFVQRFPNDGEAEKRPFFLENTAYFNPPIQLLSTRRIADPLVGGRATGRAGAYSVGAMVVDDRSPFDGGSADVAQLASCASCATSAGGGRCSRRRRIC